MVSPCKWALGLGILTTTLAQAVITQEHTYTLRDNGRSVFVHIFADEYRNPTPALKKLIEKQQEDLAQGAQQLNAQVVVDDFDYQVREIARAQAKNIINTAPTPAWSSLNGIYETLSKKIAPGSIANLAFTSMIKFVLIDHVSGKEVTDKFIAGLANLINEMRPFEKLTTYATPLLNEIAQHERTFLKWVGTIEEPLSDYTKLQPKIPFFCFDIKIPAAVPNMVQKSIEEFAIGVKALWTLVAIYKYQHTPFMEQKPYQQHTIVILPASECNIIESHLAQMGYARLAQEKTIIQADHLFDRWQTLKTVGAALVAGVFGYSIYNALESAPTSVKVGVWGSIAAVTGLAWWLKK